MSDPYFPSLTSQPPRGRQHTYTPIPAHLGVSSPPSESRKVRNAWKNSHPDSDYSINTATPAGTPRIATMVAASPNFPTGLPPPRRGKKNPARALMESGGGSSISTGVQYGDKWEEREGTLISMKDRQGPAVQRGKEQVIPPHLIPNSSTQEPYSVFPTYDFNSPIPSSSNYHSNENRNGTMGGDRMITLEEIPDSEYRLPHVLKVKPGDILCSPDPAFTPRRPPVVSPLNPNPFDKSFSNDFTSDSSSGSKSAKSKSNSSDIPRRINSEPLPLSTTPRSPSPSEYPFGIRPKYQSYRPRTAESTTLGRSDLPDLHIQTSFPDHDHNPPHVPYVQPDLSTPPANMPPSSYGRGYTDQRRTCSTLDLSLNRPYPNQSTGLGRYSSVRVNRPLPRVPDVADRDPVKRIFLGGSGKPKKGGLEIIADGWSNLIAKAKKGKLGKGRDEKDKEEKELRGHVDHDQSSPPMRIPIPSLGYDGIRGNPINVEPVEAGERTPTRAEKYQKFIMDRDGRERNSSDNTIQVDTLGQSLPPITPPPPTRPPVVKSAGIPWPGVGEVPEEYRSTFSSPSFGASSSRHMEVDATLGEVGAEVLRQRELNKKYGWEEPDEPKGRGFGWVKGGKGKKKERERPGSNGSLRGFGGIGPRFGVRV